MSDNFEVRYVMSKEKLKKMTVGKKKKKGGKII